MTERILVAVAWPYANGSIHLGQTAGCYLPADIFARYHRLKGNDVLMVSGSDSHGTPVTLEAEKRGVSAERIFKEYHEQFLDNWKRLGITFDLFTSTHTDNHERVAQDIFLKLYENGYIYKDTMTQPYCINDSRFLADRYVGGKCPKCDFENARGDQCDDCGSTLDPEDLSEMVCLLCRSQPEMRDTEHFFLKLTAFEKLLINWITPRKQWRPNVRNFSLGYLGGGLQDRAITRDIDWGVPVPLEGYESKRLYVWFEAVIGYLSASIEWSSSEENIESWKDYWQKECRSFYFMGKDNIPFHTIIWPAMLMGYGNLNLPHYIAANEYLNIQDQKISTSRNWAIWLPDYLDRYDPDALRYVLTANMPETSDSDFSWKEYVRSNNDELVATYGNLVHRVLTMTYRNFDGSIPQQQGDLDDSAQQLICLAQQRFEETGNNIEQCKFRAALDSAMALAKAANRYLDANEPWRTVKTDPESAGNTLWVTLSVINCLKICLYPFIPFSSNRLHKMLGLEGEFETTGWKWNPYELAGGSKINKPEALFVKLDESIVAEESQRIGN